MYVVSNNNVDDENDIDIEHACYLLMIKNGGRSKYSQLN